MHCVTFWHLLRSASEDSNEDAVVSGTGRVTVDTAYMDRLHGISVACFI